MGKSRFREPPGWPRYMQAKQLVRGQFGYYWTAPHWSRNMLTAPAVFAKALGPDYATAKAECDDVLNPMFDEWCSTKYLSEFERKALFEYQAKERVPPGTFRWLAQEFEKTKRFGSVGALTQTHYRDGLKLLSNFKLRNDPRGRRFGDLALASLSSEVVDELIDALQSLPDGKVRGRIVYKAMQAGRRAWNVMYRAESKLVPLQPFLENWSQGPKGWPKPGSQFG